MPLNLNTGQDISLSNLAPTTHKITNRFKKLTGSDKFNGSGFFLKKQSNYFELAWNLNHRLNKLATHSDHTSLKSIQTFPDMPVLPDMTVHREEIKIPHDLKIELKNTNEPSRKAEIQSIQIEAKLESILNIYNRQNYGVKNLPSKNELLTQVPIVNLYIQWYDSRNQAIYPKPQLLATLDDFLNPDDSIDDRFTLSPFQVYPYDFSDNNPRIDPDEKVSLKKWIRTEAETDRYACFKNKFNITTAMTMNTGQKQVTNDIPDFYQILNPNMDPATLPTIKEDQRIEDVINYLRQDDNAFENTDVVFNTHIQRQLFFKDSNSPFDYLKISGNSSDDSINFNKFYVLTQKALHNIIQNVNAKTLIDALWRLDNSEFDEFWDDYIKTQPGFYEVLNNINAFTELHENLLILKPTTLANMMDYLLNAHPKGIEAANREISLTNEILALFAELNGLAQIKQNKTP